MTTSPDDVVLAVLHARDVMQYETLVALADRPSLDALHAGFCHANLPRTLEELSEERPDLEGDALLRVFEAQQRHREKSMLHLDNFVPGVRSYAELLALDAGDFLLRVLERMDTRTDIIRRLRARGRFVPPELLSASPFRHHLILGSVREAPDMAHVLYREVFQRDGEPEYRGQVELMSTRRQGDGSWRVLVTDWHFLGPRGGSVEIIDEQFMDLFDESEFRGGTSDRREA